MTSQPRPITQIIARWREGDLNALDELTRIVYAELRQIASRHLQRERDGHTLTPTALVAEAYLRLVGDAHVSFEDRVHFFSSAARHMRHILVDFARQRGAEKRGSGRRPVTFDDALAMPESAPDLIALDEALTALAAFDERKARAVELHYFGGLAQKEIANALGVHPNTVLRDLRLAEAWLARHMSDAAP